MTKNQTTSTILIYQTEDGKTKIETRLENETVWLTQEQMAELFQKSRSTINEHIKNIYEENELVEADTMRKFGNSEFSTNYVEMAELQAINKTPMYMSDWIARLDDFLKMAGKEILATAGKISHEQAMQKAHGEYEKYKENSKDELSKVERDFVGYIDSAAKRLKKGK
jgi:hypothetical protein